jgi:hypothetical protein
LLIDTNQPDLEHATPFGFGHAYEVTSRSLLLLELKQAVAGDKA